eukprot:COSAG06_NODE_1124_length_10620_cov_48.182587_4_plen_119_part_00
MTVTVAQAPHLCVSTMMMKESASALWFSIQCYRANTSQYCAGVVDIACRPLSRGSRRVRSTVTVTCVPGRQAPQELLSWPSIYRYLLSIRIITHARMHIAHARMPARASSGDMLLPIW